MHGRTLWRLLLLKRWSLQPTPENALQQMRPLPGVVTAQGALSELAPCWGFSSVLNMAQKTQLLFRDNIFSPLWNFLFKTLLRDPQGD